nr:MAG TPA: hypothetical protein [Caudoviricetes sp.]
MLLLVMMAKIISLFLLLILNILLVRLITN